MTTTLLQTFDAGPLLLRLIPLYFVVAMGFIAGRFLQVTAEPFAKVVVYLITPLIVLNGVLSIHLDASRLSLPFLFLSVSTLLCLINFVIGRFLFGDSTEKNILSFMAGTGNTGYFGIPLASAVLGPESVGLVVLGIMGFVVFENTLGYYMIARGHYTVEQSIQRVFKLPSVYAFVVGLLLHALGASVPDFLKDAVRNVQGAYSILGMMIVGLGAASLLAGQASTTKFTFDRQFALFLTHALINRFLVWPCIALSLLWMDVQWLHFFDTDAHRVFFIISCVPLAANSVAFAVELKTEPHKVAAAVLLSTVICVPLVPVFVTVARSLGLF